MRIVIQRAPRACGRETCTVSACFCCSPPVPWANDERNPAAHDTAAAPPRTDEER